MRTYRLASCVLAWVTVSLALFTPLAADSRADESGDWLSSVSEEISRTEYHFTERDDGSLSAPNRAQGLRVFVTPAGLRVVPRNDVEDSWELRLELTGHGRGEPTTSVTTSDIRAEKGRIEIDRGFLTEWYVNDANGLEQGFTLTAAPSGDRTQPLVLTMRLAGDVLAYPSADGQSVSFHTPRGTPALHYTKLVVRDAMGALVPARMEVGPGRLSLVVEDTAAVYPIEIDPVLTDAAWEGESPQANSFMGWSVATAGDVNGDGYSDVVVGAKWYDNGESTEGIVFVYLGSIVGPSTTPDWSVESDSVDASYGHSVSSAGDVNGDGYDDLIVGANGFSNVEQNEGAAFVYHGSSSGLSASPDWVLEDNVEGHRWGSSVSTAGDVNGDGFDDVIVGSSNGFPAAPAPSEVRVYHGSASGLSTTAAWVTESALNNALLFVDTAGDVNGDGYDDVIIGDPWYDNPSINVGLARVHYGSASGLSDPNSPDWSAEGDQAGAWLGEDVGTAGDVNGDGYSDIIVSAMLYDNGESSEGAAFVFHGSATGPTTGPGLTYDWIADTNQVSANLSAVATAGDVNGDGYSDVVIGSSQYDNGEPTEGRAWVYEGSASGLSDTAVWTKEIDAESSQFGNEVATAGDVNGDGFSDIVVGAPWWKNGATTEGRAFLYYGSPTARTSMTSDWTFEGDLTEGFVGAKTVLVGDVNGDGYGDVAINDENLHVFHGSASGPSLTPDWSVITLAGHRLAAAGDVNGDGYADIVAEDSPNAVVYYGSATGMGPGGSTALTNPSSPLFDLAWAGDVNGDGYSDVILGGNGRALVFHGSSSGISTVAAWDESPIAGFGAELSSAGDVNGDGYSDVIVAQVGFNGPWVYHGSPGGLSTTAAWTGPTTEEVTTPTTGDVNGDGYSDVVLGVSLYSNPETAEGAIFVYLGSATGLALAPLIVGESDTEFETMGQRVSTGDVNGDGYSDIVAGNLSPTRTILLLGSASGPATTPAWDLALSPPPGVIRNVSMSATGDVNGDGFNDIVLGQTAFDGPFVDSGRVLLFYGGDDGGLERIPRQFRFDDTAPIGLLGKSDEPDSFRVKTRGRSPYGRSDVRLEVEIDPLGTPFDGGGTFVSAPVDTGDPVGDSFVDFDEALSGFLIPGTPYRWRARILGDSPLFPQSPWFGLPGNALTETDLRTEITTFPYVTFASPGIRAKEVSVSTNVTVSFSEAINPLTVTSGTFRLVDFSLGTVAASLAVTPGGLQAALDPTLALAPATTYQVQLLSGIQDVGGDALVSYSSTFTTEAVAGTGTPLSVVSDEALGLAPGALTGSAVAGAGDLDGDGINDFLGGAPGLDVGGKSEAGGAAVYLGSTSESERERADIVFVGSAAHDRVGTSVAGDFDFDGDGTPDMLIGAEQFNRSGADDPVAGCNDDAPCGAGVAYLIYFDPADYPNLGNPLITDYVDLSQVGITIPGVVFTGAALGDQTGFAVAGGESLDAGSGYDIAIGAPGATTPAGAGAGILYAVFDDPTLTGSVSLTRVANAGIDEVDGFLLRGSAAGDATGFSVAFPGDVIGNSGSDLAVGAPLTDPPIPLSVTGTLNDGGTVYVIEGGTMTNGIIETVDVGGGGTNGSPIHGDQAGMQFGFQTSGTIPLNTIIETVDVGGGGGIAGATYFGEAAGDLLGYSVDGVEDTTGNGFDDVVFGAPYADPDLVNEAGVVYVVEGRSAEPSAQGTIEVSEIGDTTAGRVLIGVEEGEHAGSSIAGTGDINGDGTNDFVVGAPDNDLFATDDDAGQIYLVLDSTLSVRDADGDGATDPLDCNVNDVGVWGTPGSILDLSLTHDSGSGITTLDWSPPEDPGTTILWYDVLRSLVPGVFTSGAYCIESDQTIDTVATDSTPVSAGQTAYYMVRAENGCPEGAGSLGDGPLGEQRSGLDCPNPLDTDTDGWNDDVDNCPDDFNQDQANSDTDSHGDACDNCPLDDNEDQADSDEDGLGDVCDLPMKTVFASSEQSKGDLGGIAGADATCNALAATAGLTGTYKAWLSDDLAGPATTFVQSSIPYALVDETIVASDWADLTDGVLSNPILLDENGSSHVLLSVWTGTQIDGTPNPSPQCETASGAWTNPLAFLGATGETGSAAETGSSWTTLGSISCSSSSRIYCFEQ